MNDALGYEPDEIGEWTERKIRIVASYAQAYSTIVSANRLKPHYIDGFSGGGVHLRKDTKEQVLSTARRVLEINPPFAAYHFVDADQDKVAAMEKVCAQHENAHVYLGDANYVLPTTIFPKIRFDRYERGLCFLDPYKILLSWNVLLAAAHLQTIEAFIHFPTGDVWRNVLRNDPSTVTVESAQRMTDMWGDDSWRTAARRETRDLFGPRDEKADYDHFLEAFRKRLKEVANFKFVSKALPMRNSTKTIIYHLIFVSQNETALKVASHILRKESVPRLNG